MENLTSEDLFYFVFMGIMVSSLLVIFGLVMTDIIKYIVNKKRFNRKVDEILERWKQ